MGLFHLFFADDADDADDAGLALILAEGLLDDLEAQDCDPAPDQLQAVYDLADWGE
jgi:hypothetical protein